MGSTDWPTNLCVACGDGFLQGSEVCDDNNTTPGDGCSATCTLETGWACDAPMTNFDLKSKCYRTCGNGLLNTSQSEVCDDGNILPGDGCSALCQVEATWECTNVSNALSVCNLKCGNSKLESNNTEACDDGN